MKKKETRTYKNGAYRNKKGNVVSIAPYGENTRFTLPTNYNAIITLKFKK